jgi:hypothetical protein
VIPDTRRSSLAIQMERSILVYYARRVRYTSTMLLLATSSLPRRTEEDEYIYSLDISLCTCLGYMPLWLAVAMHETENGNSARATHERLVSSVEVHGYKPGYRDEAGRGKGLVVCACAHHRDRACARASIHRPATRARVLVVGQCQRPLRHSATAPLIRRARSRWRLLA